LQAWDNRFTITNSIKNKEVHSFYHEYFGKPTKSLNHIFHIKYANHPNALPGIISVDQPVRLLEDEKSKFVTLPLQNLRTIYSTIREPIYDENETLKKVSRHVEAVKNWNGSFS